MQQRADEETGVRFESLFSFSQHGYEMTTMFMMMMVAMVVVVTGTDVHCCFLS